LRARGIGEENARALLVQAFAADVINHIENDELRQWFIVKLDEKLNLNV
jgi:Fe-S cluster assembly protein SufD